MKEDVAVFEDKSIRRTYDEETETWYFSVVDIVGILTDQPDARGATLYWGTLKRRLKKEGSEVLMPPSTGGRCSTEKREG